MQVYSTQQVRRIFEDIADRLDEKARDAHDHRLDRATASAMQEVASELRNVDWDWYASKIDPSTGKDAE